MGADISTQKKCYIFFQSKPVSFTINMKFSYIRLRGATVARLTPDQKAACSNHVGVTSFVKVNSKRRQTGKKVSASNED